MEESEKRKERLKAMRTEASRTQSSAAAGTPGGIDHLANPLIETNAVNFTHQESRVDVLPRFDYYTDPMAAYSGNRVRSNLDVHAQLATPGYSSSFSDLSGPRISQPNPSLTHQSQTSLPPNSGMYQPVPSRGFTHHPGPRAPNSPFQMHQGMSPQSNPSLTHQSQTSLPPNSGMYQPVPPRGFTHHPSPRAPNSPFQMHRGISPQSWNASGQATTHFSLPNMGRGSPYPFGSSGRGRHQRFDRSPNPGRSGGRGLGYHGRGSSSGERSGPERFYHETMVQDPWKGSTPVLWKVVDFPMTGSNAPESSSSWMPKSIQIKKPRVAETPPKFDSGANLAEFLAAAFNESANDPADP